MQPFNVLIPEVADPDLGPLLSQLADVGYADPVVTPISGTKAPATVVPSPTGGDLPSEWREVRKLEGQSYRWPELLETYDPYVVYSGETAQEGAVHIALGHAGRAEVFGRDREYLIAFLTSGSPQVPLVEFLESDDHDESGEFLAIIRGRDDSRKMYGPGDSLPDIYVNEFPTEMYDDRVKAPGAWHKVAVIAHEDDHNTMLNHALVQARRRGDL